MSVMHSWNAVPANWESLGLPPAGTTTDLHISPERVTELVAQRPDTLELVNSWLEHHNVPSISATHGGNWLTLTDVAVANKLHETNDSEVTLRTVFYSLPAALHARVQTVAPTTYFTSSRMLWEKSRKRSGGAATGLDKGNIGRMCDGDDEPLPSGHAICPAIAVQDIHPCICTGFTDVQQRTRTCSGLRDLAGTTRARRTWRGSCADFLTDGTGAAFTVVQLNNGGTGSGPLGRVDPYLFWLRYMVDSDEGDIPQTISVSYANNESSVPQGYARSVCTLFARLGRRDVSVLFASGDFGVGPRITTVGATTSRDLDISADLSGGGFSDYLLRPDYQDEVVPTFFENLGDEYRGLYNGQLYEVSHHAEACATVSDHLRPTDPISLPDLAALARGTSPSTLTRSLPLQTYIRQLAPRGGLRDLLRTARTTRHNVITTRRASTTSNPHNATMACNSTRRANSATMQAANDNKGGHWQPQQYGDDNNAAMTATMTERHA
ncbi:peptidase S8/S53 domain-containing protein [Lactarius deliciosus]|nr:peptidase S8/S53 domain-containing protein [Lactarius deliciosus]